MGLRLSDANQKQNTTPLPNIFIDELMPKAQPAYSSVYIYAYSHLLRGQKELTNADLASALGLLETDIDRAWKYWAGQKAVRYQAETGEVEFLELLPKPSARMPVASRPPQYTPQELAVYAEKDPRIRQLFLSAQTYLGKLLTHNDMSALFSLHDWLRLPLEVIELLLAYCAANNHLSMRYIETVAVDWAEKGVTTPELAAERVKAYSREYKDIMTALGIGNRLPSPAEEKFIKKWRSEYQQSIELICLACEKTVLSIGQPSFQYADKVLSNWYKDNIKTPQDAEKNSAAFSAAKQAAAPRPQTPNVQRTNKTAPEVRKNRFVNYGQRDWDFENLEQLGKNFHQNDNK